MFSLLRSSLIFALNTSMRQQQVQMKTKGGKKKMKKKKKTNLSFHTVVQ